MLAFAGANDSWIQTVEAKDLGKGEDWDEVEKKETMEG